MSMMNWISDKEINDILEEIRNFRRTKSPEFNKILSDLAAIEDDLLDDGFDHYVCRLRIIRGRLMGLNDDELFGGPSKFEVNVGEKGIPGPKGPSATEIAEYIAKRTPLMSKEEIEKIINADEKEPLVSPFLSSFRFSDYVPGFSDYLNTHISIGPGPLDPPELPDDIKKYFTKKPQEQNPTENIANDEEKTQVKIPYAIDFANVTSKDFEVEQTEDGLKLRLHCESLPAEFNKLLDILKCDDENVRTESKEVRHIRKDVLEEAAKCICEDRDIQYGSPENSFAYIAGFWSEYDDKDIKPWEAAVMMALFKIARIKTGHYKRDNFVDAIGYLAIACELIELENNSNN